MNPQIDLYSQLAQLFHLGYRFIKAKNTDKPQWETIGKYQLKSGGFIKDYASTLFLLGVGFGASTFYTMLDIDIGSPYHPANNSKAFQKLLHTLEKKGLTHPVLIQSSHSGGIHIYYFFPKKLHTFRVASFIHVTLINAGFKFKPGHLESFPNPKPYSTNGKFSNYKPHRLPLQPDSGSYVIDRWGNIVMNAESLTHIGQVLMFLRLAEASAAAHGEDIAKIETALDWAYQLYTHKIAKYQHLDRDYSEAAREWLEDLLLTMAIGWTGKGQTNQMLQILVTYGVVFKDLEVKQELFDWVHETVLGTRGYVEHCNHHRDIEPRIWDWVNATIDNEYYVSYCGFPARRGIGIDKLVKHIKKKERKANAHNQKTAEQTQQRLTTILAMLGQLPRLIVDRIKAIQTKWQDLYDEKVSSVTLYRKKYKSLWNGSLASVEIADLSEDFTLELKSLETSLAAPSTQKVSQDDRQEQSTDNADPATVFYPKTLYEVFDRNGGLGTAGAQPTTPEDSTTPEGSGTPEDSTPEDSTKQYIEHPQTQSLERSIPPQDQNTLSTVIELVGKIRESNLQLEDNLLLEMLHHPQFDRIESLLEIGSQLLRADSWTEVESITKELCSIDKQDLWQSLTFAERSKINALKMFQKLPPEPEIILEPIPSICDPSAVAVSTPTPNVEIGTRLRRNRIKVAANRYVEVILNCEVIGRNGLNWTVQSPQGNRYNVSSAALEGGEWEIEIGSCEAGESLPSGKSTPFGIETIVRAIDGFVGKIARIYKYSKEPYAVEGELGEVRRFGFDDLFPL
jgi:hypothetical protein